MASSEEQILFRPRIQSVPDGDAGEGRENMSHPSLAFFPKDNLKGQILITFKIVSGRHCKLQNLNFQEYQNFRLLSFHPGLL